MDDSCLPEYADARKIFLQDQELSGRVSLADLSKLDGILSSDKGSLIANLRFFQNKSGQRIIAGNLKAEIEVLCQRCLQPLDLLVEDDINLVLVETEEKAKGLEELYDPWICETHKINLADLVEEQLLLALPIVCLHSDPNCLEKLDYDLQIGLENSDPGLQNPFRELESLKERFIKDK